MGIVKIGHVNPTGKLNDVVFFDSRYGKVVRTNFKPFDPQSLMQLGQRARYADICKLWPLLSNPQRIQWEQQYGNRAYQNFLSVNLRKVRIGLPPLVTPIQFEKIQFIKKLDPGMSTVLKLDIHWQHADGTITLASNEYMILRATKPKVSHSRQGDPWFRIISILPPGTVSPYDCMPDYLAIWNPVVPIVDMRIVLEANIVNGLSGETSKGVRTTALTL